MFLKISLYPYLYIYIYIYIFTFTDTDIHIQEKGGPLLSSRAQPWPQPIVLGECICISACIHVFIYGHVYTICVIAIAHIQHQLN
jgi:hypothetical protein